MKTKDFSFDLPEELIAQSPPPERGQSRLLVADPVTGAISHLGFPQITDLIGPETIMVFNDSRVRKARTQARTSAGGQVEVLFLRPRSPTLWEALVNRSKRLKPGTRLFFPEGREGVVEAQDGAVKTIAMDRPLSDADLESWGHIPLPPYIRREDRPADEERYQNVFARETGSSAAPTAGLHFTQEILCALKAKGVEQRFVTLHVGLGTFLPVRTERVEDHRMHRETFSLDEKTALDLLEARRAGKKILAVGTTSVRALESAWNGEGFRTGTQTTEIFIRPGYEFQVVDRLITNFHTPESTLLMLVGAFAGWRFVQRIYEEAVRERYRFFSYGDAVFFTGRGFSGATDSSVG